MHPSYYPNLLLRLVKWPVALCCLAALPFVVSALGDSPLASLTLDECQWLAWGAGGYFALWLFLLRHPFTGSYFSTFEHELTHALFAWTTLHRVTGLTVTWRDGGACQYEGSGGGNWLIAIGPYWFPTLVWPPLLLTPIMDPGTHPLMNGLTGVAIAYHLTSTWRETHRNQPDLKQTSWAFAGMFLPTANLLVYGAVLLIATMGFDAALAFLGDVWQGLADFTMHQTEGLLSGS